MACCLLIGVLAFPRIALVCLFLFTHFLEHAYHGLVLPIIGFILLPLTTITYGWLINSHRPIAGINLLILIVAVVIDAGGLGGGAFRRRD